MRIARKRPVQVPDGWVVLPVVILFLTGALRAQPRTDALPQADLLGARQQQALRTALLGDWRARVGGETLELSLEQDGRFRMGPLEGRFTLAGKELFLHVGQERVVYTFELGKGQVTLSGGDLAEPITFHRVGQTGRWLRGLLGVSARSVQEKLIRIAAIVLVVAACRIVILLLRRFLHFLIYCDRGPLRFLYRCHKGRTLTLHSLGLNVSKYAIYLIALGFVLTELGVNYTAYLASLSVIGLAIGFGAQGLVQDMVTGFFIVLEGQFNVGDMVEIPPHTGIVQELGLRMTRLRNYLGQEVVIPNRNIALVGNYTRGAQEVRIDIAMPDTAAAANASPIVQQRAEQVQQQFEGVILGSPRIRPPLEMESGDVFLRVELSIWPQQTWVIEQQLVPRLKDALAAAGQSIPDDRVVVFYRPREAVAVRLPGRGERS